MLNCNLAASRTHLKVCLSDLNASRQSPQLHTALLVLLHLPRHLCLVVGVMEESEQCQSLVVSKSAAKQCHRQAQCWLAAQLRCC